MNLFRKTFAEINLSSLKHNVDWIKTHFPQSPFLCPMVKGNAYGHGDIIIAKALSEMNVSHLGVCLIEEALWIKNAGVKTPLVVFRGFDNEGAKEIIRNGFIPIVSQWEQIEYLEKNIKEAAIPIHLKFDTGMNRLGFNVKEADKLFERFWKHPKLRVKALVTHLYQGEDFLISEGHSQRQLQKINQVASQFSSLKPIVHTLNSAGIVGSFLQKKHLQTQYGLRPGLLIYGYQSPMLNTNDPLPSLKPVMSIKSIVSDIRHISKGEGVSYSHTWIAKRDSVIAIIPIGYADGIHRQLSNKGEVIIRNKKAPIVGSICMDYLMVDLTEIMSEVEITKNEEVILFGANKDQSLLLGADEVANKVQTITWEVLTSIGVRVPRVISNS